MYMRCLHAGTRSRLGELNLLDTWYQVPDMITQMHVCTMTGCAWQSSCAAGCVIDAVVSFLSTPCPFLTYLLPSHLPDLLPAA